jgi:outer membrane protein assembly factor BamB
VRLARTGGRSLSSARSLRRPRTLLLALVVLAVGAALIRVGTERLTTSCGESFGRIDGRLVAGRPFARALATASVSAADRRDLATSARAIAPGAGVGAPAWAAATKFPLQVVGLGDRIVVRDLGTVGALRASDGRLLWQRRLPHLPALLEPWRDGVAVLSAPEAGDSGAVRVALLDRDGGMLRCTTLRSDVAPDRFHVATTASGLVAVLEGGAKRSRVRLFASSGRQQLWSTTVDGDYASVAIDGPVVVLADRAQAGGGAAVVGLGARDGRQRWTLAARELAGDVPTPTAAVADRSPRLTRLQSAGRLVIGHAVLHVEDGNELPGRLVALDLRSGRPTWRTRRTVQLRPADTFEVAGDLVLLARRAPSETVDALDASTGRRRWRADALFAGDGSLLRSGERIYVTGGRPAILDARNGSKLLLSRHPTLPWFGTAGALTDDRLAIVVDHLSVLIAWGRP